MIRRTLLLVGLISLTACAGNRNLSGELRPEPRHTAVLPVAAPQAFGVALDVAAEHGWPTNVVDSGAHYLTFRGGDDSFWTTRCEMTLRVIGKNDGTSEVRVTAKVQKIFGGGIEATCRETVLSALEKAVIESDAYQGEWS